VNTAGETLRDLRVAEVLEQDLHIEEAGEIIFRTKLRPFMCETPCPAQQLASPCARLLPLRT